MKTFISILCTIVLTLLLPVTALVYRVDSYILQPEPLLAAAEQGKLFDTLVPALADAYITDSTLQEMGLNIVPRTEAVTLVSTMFHADWTRTVITQLVQQLFLLRAPGTTLADLNLTLDLTGPKERFLTELSTVNLPTGDDAFYPVLIAAFIPQQLNLGHFMIQSTGAQAPDPSDPLGIKRAGDALTPDERALLIENTPEQIAMVQGIVARVHALLPALWLLCAILFGGILVSNIGENRHIFRWISIATFFPGTVLLTLGLSDDVMIAPQVDAKLATLPSSLHTLARAVTTPYISQFFDFFTILGIAALGITMASILVGVIEKRYHHPHKKHA